MSESNINAVVECYVEKRFSKRTGNVYQVLVMKFENGYKMDTFLNNEQFYIISQCVPVKE